MCELWTVFREMKLSKSVVLSSTLPFLSVRTSMRKIATLVAIILLTTVASFATRPLLGAAQAMAPSVIVNVSIGSTIYSVDVTSTAALFLSPEKAVLAAVHGLQDAMAANPNAMGANPDPGNEVHIQHTLDKGAVTVDTDILVHPGDTVDITHTIENSGVKVDIVIDVTVGQPASVDQTVTHP